MYAPGSCYGHHILSGCWDCCVLYRILIVNTHTPGLLSCCVVAAYGYGVSAVPLLYTLRHTMIRHTKAQSIQGQSVLALPDKTEELVPGVC